jgi:hypothetical protein
VPSFGAFRNQDRSRMRGSVFTGSPGRWDKVCASTAAEIVRGRPIGLVSGSASKAHFIEASSPSGCAAVSAKVG